MKVVLELQDQPSNVRRITVRHDIVIGRGSDCNLRLSAPQVSRRHCFLRVGRDSVSVTDLDSSNGTYVDGTRIAAGKRYDITNGSELALGPIRFTVHVRSDVVVADSAKSNMAGGAPNESLRTDTGRDSVAGHSMRDEGTTDGGRSRGTDSGARMDYTVENGGLTAEPFEPTADYLENQSSASGSSEWFSPEADPMDSRLEIIDFGRRLSEQSPGGVSGIDPVGKSESMEEEPKWESAIIDSSESSDDLDVLSIATDSGVKGQFEDEPPSSAKALRAKTDIDERPKPDTTLDTAEIAEGEWESSWFADDGADPCDIIDEVNCPDDVAKTHDDDQNGPDLKGS